jgi:cytochrome c oxidase assembly factor CtaG
MGVLYFTPLYVAMMGTPALHYVVHFHFVAAGCLYAWVIAGPDPAPYRPSVPARLVLLGVAVVLHSVLAQSLYAGLFVSLPIPSDQLRQAAELMYYGGDITEMLLAFALVTTWKPARRPNPRFSRWLPISATLKARDRAEAQARKSPGQSNNGVKSAKVGTCHSASAEDHLPQPMG